MKYLYVEPLEARIAPATVMISPLAQNEGDVDNTFKFQVTLDSSVTTTTTVGFNTLLQAGDTAVAGLDFEQVDSVLTFTPGGPLTQTIDVVVHGNSNVDPDRTFSVELKSPSDGLTISGNNPVKGTILDDEGTVSIDGNVTVAEGNTGESNMNFSVRLSAAASHAVTVSLRTVDGTAHAGSDFTGGPFEVTFQPGETVKTAPIKIKGDTLFGLDESFQLEVVSVLGGKVGAPSTATGTITNDDATTPLPTVSITGPSSPVGETGGPAVFTVGLSALYDSDITVSYSTVNGTATAGSDFNAPSGTLVIPGHTPSGTISVSLISDGIFEPTAEKFSVQLNSAVNSAGTAIGIPAATSSAEATIAADPVPTFSIEDGTLVEGAAGEALMSFVVRLNGPLAGGVTVKWGTEVHEVANSALAGTDYVASTGNTLTFGPFQTTQTIFVPVKGDILEESNETFLVKLSEPSTGVLIGDGSAVGTIVNDDLHVRIADVAVEEGEGGIRTATFTITLDRAQAQAVTMDVKTIDGSGTNGAKGGPAFDTTHFYDYKSIDTATSAAADSLTFLPGETFKTVTVEIQGDQLAEVTEKFSLQLSNAMVGGVARSLSPTTAEATIITDDPTTTLVTVAAVKTEVPEGPAGTPAKAPFIIKLSEPVPYPVTVMYKTSANSTEQSIDIGAGKTSSDPIEVEYPGNDEPLPPGVVDPTVFLTVTSAAQKTGTPPEATTVALGTTPTASTTIIDDDVLVSLGATASTVEGNAGTKTLNFAVFDPARAAA